MITSCREIVDLVTEYLEGSMSVEQRVEFERHLVACPPCRGYLMQMRGLLRAAGTLRDEQLPPELRAAVMQHFAEWQQEQHE